MSLGIDEDGGAGLVVLHAEFKGYVRFRLLHAVDGLQQLAPEVLCVLLFVTTACLGLHKGLRRAAPFNVCHRPDIHDGHTPEMDAALIAIIAYKRFVGNKNHSYNDKRTINI